MFALSNRVSFLIQRFLYALGMMECTEKQGPELSGPWTVIEIGRPQDQLPDTFPEYGAFLYMRRHFIGGEEALLAPPSIRNARSCA